MCEERPLCVSIRGQRKSATWEKHEDTKRDQVCVKRDLQDVKRDLPDVKRDLPMLAYMMKRKV